MIIHRYILRKKKDRGLIDRSETEYCCNMIEKDIGTEHIQIRYHEVLENNIEIDKCPFCKVPISYQKHYVSSDTMYKHTSREFKHLFD